MSPCASISSRRGPFFSEERISLLSPQISLFHALIELEKDDFISLEKYAKRRKMTI